MNPLRVMALACALSACLAVLPASADEAVSFKGKTVTMIIPSTAGAGTDLSGRLFARYFSKYLPGQPTVVSSNIPAGHGITALNYLVNQSKPDGLTVVMASDSQADPLVFRVPQSRYDPLSLPIVGAVGTSDTILIARVDALPRLMDASAKPINMGSVGGAPRASARMAVWGREYLGWNIQWVVGYPGSSDLALAMERGEIDMTTFPAAYLVDKLTDRSKYKIVYRTGFSGAESHSGSSDLDSAPEFADTIAGKVTTPDMKAAFEYWRAQSLFKWIALPPKTPDAIVAAYRQAYLKSAGDPDFKKQATTIAESFSVLPPDEATKLVYDLAGASNEAIAAMSALMNKQGLKSQGE